MSLITPLLLVMVMVVPMWLATRDVPAKEILVDDESGLFKDKFQDDNLVEFEYYEQPLSVAKEIAFTSGKYGVLHIPKIDVYHPQGITLITEYSASIEVKMNLERQIDHVIEDYKLEISGIDKEKLDQIKTSVSIETNIINESGQEQEIHTEVAYVVGYLGSFLIYILIFAYGIQTMRGVIEEKTNRIVEVIISSVKPYQLMAGKIIGIGGVGLTQFLIWIFLTFMFYSAVGLYMNLDQLQQVNDSAVVQMGAMNSQNTEMVKDFFDKIDNIPFGFLIGVFIFYFIGAYLFYGSLFAAIGSAVDSESDAQQFQLPVTLPLIFSLVVLAAILRDPHGDLAVWLSIIPFTSPIVMMMRFPFIMNDPGWDLFVSMGVLVLSIVITIWMAAKIYRIGILSYGTKPTYKMLFKWIFAKN